MYKIGFIGAGNMAYAIAGGIFNSSIKQSGLQIYDKNTSQYDRFKSLSAQASQSIEELVNDCDVIFLSVKPQNFSDILPIINNISHNDKLFISIAAGITTSYIESILGRDTKIVRVMPNTGLLVGCGAAALTKNKNVTDDEFAFAKNVFDCAGVTEIIDEKDMNAIVSVHGSSPAYIYLFAKSIIDGSVKLGIDKDKATNLILETFEGALKMMRESGMSVDELIKMVSSPGGTTLKALEVFEKDNIERTVYDAMLACKIRADELSK